jgi:hypothetical protein
MAQTTMEATGLRALPRLSWGPVIAGVLLALATHVVLGLIGAAIGFAAQPADSAALGAAAAAWGLVTPFVATLLGAWLATRMAGAWDTAGANLHGVMVWCIGLLAGAIFLTGTLAAGAMTAGTAASGNAGALQRLTGVNRGDVVGPGAAANADRRADVAGEAAAGAAGGAAMAAIAGLLGAFVGATLARQRTQGRGLGFRIAIQRDRGEAQRAEGGAPYGRRIESGAGRRYEPERPVSAAARTEETTREVTRTEGPGAPPVDPYHH